MVPHKVVFSPVAVRDLTRIVRFIARDNPNAADEFGQRLITRALELGEPGMAMMGSAIKKRPGARRLVEGNYLIFYRVFPKRYRIRVLRFWNAARDMSRIKLNV